MIQERLPTKSWSRWQVREVDLAEIGPIDFESFSARFRSDEPTLLVYHLRDLPWVGVAKCAPLNHMLWATEFDGLGQFRTQRAWSAPLARDKVVYTAFRRELRRARIRKSAIPWELLGPYAHWGAYLDENPSLSFKLTWFGRYRVWGSIAPITFKDALVEFYSRQIQQFGRYAFWPAPEGSEEDSNDDRPIQANLTGYLGARLWKHPTRFTHTSESERREALLPLRDELKRVIARLEAGEEWNLPLHYEDVIRPAPMFLLVGEPMPATDDPALGAIALAMGNFVDSGARTALDAEVCCYRARLVRLLAWPSLYRSTFGDDPMFREGLIRQARAPHFAGAMPYDLVEEMLLFKQEMEERYPVLLENPIAGLA